MPRPPPSDDEPSATERMKASFGEPDAGSDLTWGVGAVSSRLNITASTLRTWERRYGVGPSFRTAGGHRRYTDHDIDRVELMRRLLGRGVSAKDAARVARSLDRDDLDHALTDGYQISDEYRDLAGGEKAEEDFLAAVVAGEREQLGQLFAGVLRQNAVTSAWQNFSGTGPAADDGRERVWCRARRCGLRGVGDPGARAERAGDVRTAP